MCCAKRGERRGIDQFGDGTACYLFGVGALLKEYPWFVYPSFRKSARCMEYERSGANLALINVTRRLHCASVSICLYE